VACNSLNVEGAADHARGRIHLSANLAQWLAKPRRLCGKRLSPTLIVLASNCHCRIGSLPTGFSLLRLKSWI